MGGGFVTPLPPLAAMTTGPERLLLSIKNFLTFLKDEYFSHNLSRSFAPYLLPHWSPENGGKLKKSPRAKVSKYKLFNSPK